MQNQVWRRGNDAGAIDDAVVTRAYHLCALVRDIGAGVVAVDRILAGECEADARAFIEAVDEVDGPGSERVAATGPDPRRRLHDESRRRHISRLVEEHAGPAFWQQVALAFPHVKTGDFPPDATFALDNAMERAVRAWLAWNEPQPTHDQMATFGRLMHEASVGSYGITQSVFAALAAYTPPMSPAQAGCKVDDRDLVVTVGSQDDENAEDPGTERTSVVIVAPDGAVKASYEVQ